MNEKRRRANALMMKYYSGMIDESAWRHASGDIAVFNTKYRRDLKSLIVQLEPIQAGSGDPSPDNVRPITGWTGATIWRTGKNLLPMPITSGSYANGVTIVVNDDKSFYFNKPNGTGWTAFAMGAITLLPGTYTLIEWSSAGAATDSALVLENTELGVSYTTRYTSRLVFTIDSTINFNIRYTRAAASDNVLIKLMLFVGNTKTADDYVPYTGTTYPVSWETEAGTVYGGTIDVVSGKLTVDRAYAVLNDPDLWIESSSTTNYIYTYRFTNRKYFNSSFTGLLCTYLPVDSNSTSTARWAGASDPKFGLKISSVTLDQIKTAAVNNDIVICYILATPQTYQLTPQQIQTLIGENVIWSDAGPVSVEYWS